MIDHLLVEYPDPLVCIIRMNRPAQYNALSRALLADLRAEVAKLAQSPVRVVILAANGKGFCAGADLKERASLNDEEKYAHNRQINGLANDLAALPMPTIAMIHGLAMGGGCELSLACDMRFIATEATIGLTEARIGAMPGAGGSQRLPRLIGAARALEMMYGGEPISPAKAAEWGLVNAVLPLSELETHVLDLARKLTLRSRRATELLKRSVYGGLDGTLEAALELERVAVVEILASPDYREGLAAFAEKRAPEFD